MSTIIWCHQLLAKEKGKCIFVRKQSPRQFKHGTLRRMKTKDTWRNEVGATLHHSENKFATCPSFVTEHICVCFLNGFHRIFFVNKGRQESHLNTCHHSSSCLAPLFLHLSIVIDQCSVEQTVENWYLPERIETRHSLRWKPLLSSGNAGWFQRFLGFQQSGKMINEL